MRKDMFKVIVERGRYGGHGARKRRAPRDIEDVPARGHRRAAAESGDRKSLNETLAPLRRFIEGQEGRPWDKVYSELRENIKPGNTVQEHVLEHIENFIELQVELVKPNADAPCGVRSKPGRRYWGFINGLRAGDLYVDPNDGIVKRARLKFKGPIPKREQWSDNNKLLLKGQLYARREAGIWYGYVLTPYTVESSMRRVQQDDGTYTSERRVELVFPDGKRAQSVMDEHRGRHVWGNDSIAQHQLTKLYGAQVIAATPRRQLSREELKRYGLSNGSEER